MESDFVIRKFMLDIKKGVLYKMKLSFKYLKKKKDIKLKN